MNNHLFNEVDLYSVLREQEKVMFNEIDSMDGNLLLNTSAHDLCDYFEQKYCIEVPILKEEQIQVEYGEARIDVRGRFDYDVRGGRESLYVTGTKVTFYVPFEGDADLFRFTPSSYTFNPPRALIHGNELLITIEKTQQEADQIKGEFERTLDDIRQYLVSIKRDVDQFNPSVREKAKSRLETRREKLLKDQGLAASLGFPLRRREDAPQTYVVPTHRRKATPSLPKAKSAPYAPEPTLAIGEYEHILSVISNMVDVMERSPQAFHGMKEEDLRNHFLVQLNGQYEGQATGETFNFEGKTDILIRVQGKNIFGSS